jgi:hypothetical protein
MSRLIWSLTAYLLAGLAVIIWVASTGLAAASGFTAMVATTLLPGVSQAYWIASIHAATGAFPQPLTKLCVIWLGLFVVLIYARDAAIRRMARQAA